MVTFIQFYDQPMNELTYILIPSFNLNFFYNLIYFDLNNL